MVFKKVCPRCKRRYPQNFTSCLECGSLLIDTESEERKEQLRKYLPILGMILLCCAVIGILFVFVLPLVQHTLSPVQASGNLSKTQGQSAIMTTFTLNQPASDGNLKVVITKTRDGVTSAGSKKFFLVTVILQNLQADKTVRVSASDFTLLDSTGKTFPSYGLGDRIAQEIEPFKSESYDLTYEIPQDAVNLRIRYTFPGSGDRSGQTVMFFL